MVYCKSTNSGPQAVLVLVLSFHSFEEMFLRKNLEKHVLQCEIQLCFSSKRFATFGKSQKHKKKKPLLKQHGIDQNKNSSFQNSTSST
jgi:hypothetical protein